MDGLTIDGNGNIYVSCWGDNAIYRYDNTFSLPAELISSGHNGPADIFYNQLNNILAIPNFYSNEVDFIPITPIGVNEGNIHMPSSFVLWQNYPNPFNPSTRINYSVPHNSFIQIKLFDILGNEVAILVSEEKQTGDYSISFNASGLSSGIYFYQLRATDLESSSRQVFIETKKMILLR